MTDLKTFIFNPFQVNTYVISDQNKNGFVIDAACSEDDELGDLLEYIKKMKIRVRGLINTHCHVDHILGIENLRRHLKTDFMCSENEQFLLDNAVAQGQFFGLDVSKPSTPDKYISEQDVLHLDSSEINIIHVPGHSPGSLIFYLPSDRLMFSGDALFSGSVGRTDLPGGDYMKLVEGIKHKLLIYDDEVKVYPGHGPSTTIGNEKMLNPFLQ